MTRTTVFFATNRRENPGAADPAQRFGAAMSDVSGTRLAWGTAFVEGTDPDPDALVTGRVESVQEVATGAMPAGMRDDILGSGKDLLIFVHGFANSFPDAIARAAFNREWLATAALPADCTVLAFTWPSPGLVVDPGDVPAGVAVSLLTLLGLALNRHLVSPLTNRYQQDQRSATASGPAFGVVLETLAPLLRELRANGRRTHLLVHSMGHVVLQNAIGAWQSAHRPAEVLFDHAVLAAGDAAAAQAGAAPPWLVALPLWSAGTSLYLSDEDSILILSALVNNDTPRLGYKGPPDQGNAALFPPDRVRFVACGALEDEGPGAGIDGGHQYYRRLPAVRDDMALALAGQGAPGQVTL